MPRTPQQLLAFLDELGIVTETVEHDAVFTVEQAKAVRSALALVGMHIKNLFLRNKKRKMWLVVAQEDRRIDLKSLASHLGAGHLSFGSPDRLMQYLGVEAGAVTPFAIINDSEGVVQVVIDEAVAAAGMVHCHPLDNRMTTAIAADDLLRFVAACDHQAQLVNFEQI